MTADYLPMLRRFATEPGLVGANWAGLRGAGAVDGRLARDGFFGEEDGRLIAAAASSTAPPRQLGCRA